jgi:hypothetical protein
MFFERSHAPTPGVEVLAHPQRSPLPSPLAPSRSGFTAAPIRGIIGFMAPRREQKITFQQMREMGVHGLLIYCSDYKCSHSIAISGDVRLSDIEPLFTARHAARGVQTCGQTSVRSARNQPLRWAIVDVLVPPVR